jgi:hypothetical protein
VPLSEDKLLRIELYYRSFSVYNTGTDYYATSTFGLRLGYVLSYAEPPGHK